MSKFLHEPPKFSRGPSVVRGPPVGDRCTMLPYIGNTEKLEVLYRAVLNSARSSFNSQMSITCQLVCKTWAPSMKLLKIF